MKHHVGFEKLGGFVSWITRRLSHVHRTLKPFSRIDPFVQWNSWFHFHHLQSIIWFQGKGYWTLLRVLQIHPNSVSLRLIRSKPRILLQSSLQIRIPCRNWIKPRMLSSSSTKELLNEIEQVDTIVWDSIVSD